jgi:hypothetical protein
MLTISKNRLTTVCIMLIFLLAIIPTALGATPSKTVQFQDDEWFNFYIIHEPLIVPHLDNIAAAIEEEDYNKLYDESQGLSIDSEASLKKSKEFKVSPELRNAKEEYEFSQSDNLMIAKYFMIAANKQNAGDIAGRKSACMSAVTYIESASTHSDNMMNYLHIYWNGLKKVE